MGGKSVTLTQADQRISNIRVQTSSQGLVIPVGFGRFRTNCNLLWYGNFRAIENKSVTSQGGKGGGGGVTQETITYTYEAAIMVALCHGPINGVISAWRGKERLMGQVIPARRKTLKHTVTVPTLVGAATWSVVVPSSASFAANVIVNRYSNDSRSFVRRLRANLTEGFHYTQALGTYTFLSTASGAVVEISYQIVDVAESWLSVLGMLNMSLAYGTLDQPIWPWLQSFKPDEALAYPTTAYAYSQAYSLTSAAELNNHNFEVSTGYELGMLPGRAEEVVDADPRDIVEAVLTNETWGAVWDAGKIKGLERYSDYCVSHGFWMSPFIDEQAPAHEHLGGILQLTNTDVVYDGSALEFVPLGDQDVTANGRTFVADTTPVVDIDFSEHMITELGKAPLRIKRHQGQQGSSELADGDDVGFNVWTLEIENRANGYNTEPVSYEDTAHILMHGRRSRDSIKASAIKDVQVGAAIVSLLCQSELARRNVYEFSVPWTMGFLKPLDLVTLTDPTFQLDRKPVRLLTVDEDGDRRFVCTARDSDIGIASAPAYGAQAGLGFAHDYNAQPGDVAGPLFFEPPVELATSTGLEVWIAVTGTTPLWGGCEVWSSIDGGVNYKRMGKTVGGARYGATTATMAAGTGASLAVQLAGRGGQVLSATTEDAQLLKSLLYVRQSGGQPEFLAYTDALLTGANAYTLTGLARGAYGSLTGSQASGAEFARVDDLILRSEPMQYDMIGREIKFKLLSYNVFGAAIQALEDVSEYSYTVTGDMVKLPPDNVVSFTLSIQADGTRQFDWSWGTREKPPFLKGYIVRFRQGTGPFDWDDLKPFATDDGFQTASPIESNLLLAGPYVFAIKTVDTYGVVASTPLFIDATLPDPRLGNALEYVDEFSAGWPGTLTDCVKDSWQGEVIVRARDQATWDTLPSTWNAWTRFVWDPVSSFVYETLPIDFGAAVTVLPVANFTADGDVVFEVATSADGTTWSAYATLAGPLVTRHVRSRVSVSVPVGSPSGPGVTPVCALRRLAIAYIGKVTAETGNDLDTSTLTGVHRIGVGDIRLPVQKTWVHISRISVSLQSVAAGWTWSVFDKNGTDGPRIKIYNGSGALADALIDWTVEGIST